MSSSQEEAREARRLRRNERDRDYYYYYCFYSTAAGFIVMFNRVFNYSIVWMKMISYTQVIHGVAVAREE